MKKKPNNFNKSSHGNNRKFYSKVGKKKTPVDPTAKKFKHIQRNKEAEETLRRQRELEHEYTLKHKEVEDSCEEDEEEELHPLDQLLSTFKGNRNKKTEAIESSSESEDDEDDDASEDDSDVDQNEISSGDSENVDENDEEVDSGDDSEDEENQNSDDDSDDGNTKNLSNLRPEESKNKKMSKKTVSDDSGDNEDETDDENDEDEDEDELDSDDEEATTKTFQESDMFSSHIDHELNPEMLECISSQPPKVTSHQLSWPILGRLQIDIPSPSSNKPDCPAPKKKKKTLLDDEQIYASEGVIPKLIDIKSIDLDVLAIKPQMRPNLAEANKKHVTKTGPIFTLIQAELISIFNNYQDLYYPNRSIANGEEVRVAYCLHALNHVLKTRARVLLHNTKMAKNPNTALVPDCYRDQGMVRPKVLILVPFRDSALKVVTLLIHLLFGDSNGTVMNIKRFLEEYSGDSLYFPKRNPKPEDYEQTFCGNTDDTFRIGISLTKKTIKLYSDFYSSDILIASPLGLRMIIGAAGDEERDYDFLASIELLIMDQTDLFVAQNWDHLLHFMDHLHLQPQSARNTDFARVRSWCLNGWSRFYRQTLMFSSHDLPEFRSLFNSRCANYRGKVRVANPIVAPSIRHVALQVPQVFHRVEVSSIQTSFDQRFNHFINIILPQFRSSAMAHCLIYVPSYFDYVRIRNYFKKETTNFVQICEYTKDGKIARARDMFYHGSAHFMLYSERAHFFRRTRIKGIRHIIFYQPPTWPHFYPEMINLMQEANRNTSIGDDGTLTVTVMYTKYDMIQVASIVGTERAAKMDASDKRTHMFLTGE